MEQHAVPHSVTNFEFKLIGWFTVKQFMYLLLFVGFAVVLFFAIPVPILNIIMAVVSVLIGVALVFYRYNERPLDVWIKNLAVSLTKASQYLYDKNNEAPDFLKGVFLSSSAEIAQIHLDASQKLNNYIAQSGQARGINQDKQAMNTLIHSTPALQQTTAPTTTPAQPQTVPVDMSLPGSGAIEAPTPTNIAAPSPTNQPLTQSHTIPYLSGIIKNSKDEVLPNIMVYVSTEAGQIVRILKTNHNGIFATFHPLPSGTYILSPKDLGGTYFFDTMSMSVEGPQHEPISVFSKEML